MQHYAIALLCILGLSTGQILMKLGASALFSATPADVKRGAFLLAVAIAIYGLATVGWICILKNGNLGRIYPLMALAFVFVPIGCFFFLGERFPPQYFFGIALIMAGVVLAARS